MGVRATTAHRDAVSAVERTNARTDMRKVAAIKKWQQLNVKYVKSKQKSKQVST